MESFKVFINLEILEEVPKTGKVRSEIMAFIKSL